MTGGDLLLKIGFEGVRRNGSYIGRMTRVVADCGFNNLRCIQCKYDCNNPNNTICMTCPVFTVETSEFLYDKFGSM